MVNKGGNVYYDCSWVGLVSVVNSHSSIENFETEAVEVLKLTKKYASYKRKFLHLLSVSHLFSYHFVINGSLYPKQLFREGLC